MLNSNPLHRTTLLQSCAEVHMHSTLSSPPIPTITGTRTHHRAVRKGSLKMSGHCCKSWSTVLQTPSQHLRIALLCNSNCACVGIPVPLEASFTGLLAPLHCHWCTGPLIGVGTRNLFFLSSYPSSHPSKAATFTCGCSIDALCADSSATSMCPACLDQDCTLDRSTFG